MPFEKFDIEFTWNRKKYTGHVTEVVDDDIATRSYQNLGRPTFRVEVYLPGDKYPEVYTYYRTKVKDPPLFFFDLPDKGAQERNIKIAELLGEMLLARKPQKKRQRIS